MVRGKERKQPTLFASTTAESLVERGLAKNHPLRKARANVNAVLASLHHEIDELYSSTGRPSIPPERQFRAMVWQSPYTIRSERLLEQQIRFDMKCRRFLGLTIDEHVWDHSVFSTARENVWSRDAFVEVDSAGECDGIAGNRAFASGMDGSRPSGCDTYGGEQPGHAEPHRTLEDSGAEEDSRGGARTDRRRSRVGG